MRTTTEYKRVWFLVAVDGFSTLLFSFLSFFFLLSSESDLQQCFSSALNFRCLGSVADCLRVESLTSSSSSYTRHFDSRYSNTSLASSSMTSLGSLIPSSRPSSAHKLQQPHHRLWLAVIVVLCLHLLCWRAAAPLRASHHNIISLHKRAFNEHEGGGPAPGPDEESAALINWLALYDQASPSAKPALFVGMVVWLIFLFAFVGITASDFFCPNLSTIASRLGLSESVVSRVVSLGAARVIGLHRGVHRSVLHETRLSGPFMVHQRCSRLDVPAPRSADVVDTRASSLSHQTGRRHFPRLLQRFARRLFHLQCSLAWFWFIGHWGAHRRGIVYRLGRRVGPPNPSAPPQRLTSK